MRWRDLYVGVVNLDSRSDRLAHVTEEMKKLGLPWERQRGMLPSEFGDPRCEVMRRRTPGAIGCHFSQLEVLKRGKGRDTLILEDDVCFASDIQKRLDYVERFLEAREWDIFWLGATFHVNPAVWHLSTIGRDVEQTSDPRVLQTYGIWSTYAWIVNRRSADRLLALCDKWLEHSIGIDWLFIQVQPELKTYCFVPGMAWQYDNQSNIGNGVTEFSHFKKLGPYVWQDKMEDFDPATFNWAEAEHRRIATHQLLHQ